MSIQAINPATDQVVGTYHEMTLEDVRDVIAHSHQAFQAWRSVSWADRAAAMRRAAGLLKRNAPSYARLMAQEMGKPVRDGVAEAEKCAWVCEHYAERTPAYLAPELVPTDASRACVTFQPLGVVLAVMPWNFPF